VLPNKFITKFLSNAYNRLYSEFGPQHWWPADSAFEVVVGAILTQNTTWSNVEKAIAQLRQQKLLTPNRLRNTNLSELGKLIRPCGYYNVKAKRLKNFLEFLFVDFKGRLPLLFSLSRPRLREKLLKVNGIGPETADSILLYAAEKPVFVVDAYTRRFLTRHRLIKPSADYQKIQRLFEDHLPRRIKLFNEYHALIVRLGKEFCRSRPLCNRCPLKKWK